MTLHFQFTRTVLVALVLTPVAALAQQDRFEALAKSATFENRPTTESAEKLMDELLVQRASQVYLWAMPLIDTMGMKVGSEETFGAGYHVLPIWSKRLSAKTLITTPNSDVIYAMSYVDLGKEGPLVVDAPPQLQGILLDFWQRPIQGPIVRGQNYMGDGGFFGPDQGKGGTFLLLPPNYTGLIPEGYFPFHSQTNNVFIFLRGFYQDAADLSPGVQTLAAVRVYPLGNEKEAKAMTYPDASGVPANLLPRTDAAAFEHLNYLVDTEGATLADPDWVGMLADYIDPGQTFVTCPNQDVVYGLGFFALDEEPVVVQVPDFGDRFWVYALYDARTDQFAELGKPYKTKPGFYLLVGPKWPGDKPAGIEAVIRSSTALANAIPRVFMDDTPEDRKAIQPMINQIVFYPLKDFDGTMKTQDWAPAPAIPGSKAEGGGETKWVVPETFFDQLGAVLDTVPPLPGEETLYGQFRVLLDAAAKDPAIKQALVQAALETEREVISPFLEWQRNGRPAGNGWNRSTNNARFGHDYYNRTGTAKSNMFGNKPTETQYFYTDDDSEGARLDGTQHYEVSFAPGQEPPVSGFWSMTLYNGAHFFHPNSKKRYSLGTKNNADGSLTLYVGAKSPGAGKESNWLPAPDGHFSLYIRAYWGEQAILDGSWQPPVIRPGK